MRAYCIVLLLGVIAGCASSVPQNVQSQLAPAGTLRVGLNMGNTLLTAKDPAGGEPRGVAVAIARELGRRIGVPLRVVSYDTPDKLGDSVKSGQWDIAFFAIEPARAGMVDFSLPYVEIETTYLVRKDSNLRNVGDVDREGVVVMVGRGAGYESILANTLKHAKLMRASATSEGVRILTEREADAAAGLRPALIIIAEEKPDFRVLEGRFATVQQAIGIQKGRPAAAEYLNGFIQDITQSGFVAKVISENNVRGLTIVK